MKKRLFPHASMSKRQGEVNDVPQFIPGNSSVIESLLNFPGRCSITRNLRGVSTESAASGTSAIKMLTRLGTMSFCAFTSIFEIIADNPPVAVNEHFKKSTVCFCSVYNSSDMLLVVMVLMTDIDHLMKMQLIVNLMT